MGTRSPREPVGDEAQQATSSDLPAASDGGQLNRLDAWQDLIRNCLEGPHPSLDQALIVQWFTERPVRRFQPEAPTKQVHKPHAMVLQAGGLQARRVEPHASGGLLNITTDSYGAAGVTIMLRTPVWLPLIRRHTGGGGGGGLGTRVYPLPNDRFPRRHLASVIAPPRRVPTAY